MRKTLRISNKGFENSGGCGKSFGCQDDAKMLDFTPLITPWCLSNNVKVVLLRSYYPRALM